MKRRNGILIFLLTACLAALPVRAEKKEVTVPVVMYHHISQNPKKWNDYVVSVEEFRRDMDYLQQNGWESISIPRLLDWVDGKAVLPEKPFLLTFDDGFESTLAYAEPIVAEHGFCGTVAVIGSVCEKFSQCNEHDPELSNLSWEDAEAMMKRGVIQIQCHTWNMHGLKNRRGCAPLKWESEAEYMKKLTEDLVHYQKQCAENGIVPVPAIAYPYGEYTALTTKVVKELGFRAAFTCTEKCNRLTGDREELYTLGRYNRPHGVSSEKFFEKWEKTIDNSKAS